MNQTEQMREALREALAAMRLHSITYPHMDKGYMVDARAKALQALATEPAKLVRLTEGELFHIFDRTSCGDDAQRNILNFANAIMDAMQAKNGGKP